MGACLSSLLKVDEDLEERFTLTKKLGEGVEGQVWEAELLDRPGEVVAIKLVPRCAVSGVCASGGERAGGRAAAAPPALLLPPTALLSAASQRQSTPLH